MECENEGLIKADPAPEPSTTSQLTIFLLLQFAQLFWFLLRRLCPQFLFSLGHLAIAAGTVRLSQSNLGRVLVGLSWKFDFAFTSGRFWSHEIEPDPFLPTKLNSNCFWVGVCGSAVFSAFITLHALISRAEFPTVLLSLLISAIYIVNLVVFFKVQQIASKANVEVVRTVLLGQNSTFPDAQEVTDSDEEEVNQQAAGPKEPVPREQPADKLQAQPEEDEIE
jgi:hypothetical protein